MNEQPYRYTRSEQDRFGLNTLSDMKSLGQSVNPALFYKSESAIHASRGSLGLLCEAIALYGTVLISASASCVPSVRKRSIAVWADGVQL